MTQRVLNFTVESTEERLTPRAGEIVLGEFFKGIGLKRFCDRHLPAPGSNRGYQPYEIIQPLLLMLHAGGKALEDIRLIASDRALREILGMKRIPKADTIGKWLKRIGLEGVYGIEAINRILLARYLKHLSEPLVLDIDASAIENDKSIATLTYHLVPGFTPMIGHINGGFVIYSQFRPGNMAPANENSSFVKRCEAQLPPEKKIAYLRADSASYQAELFNYCQKQNIVYLIGGRLDGPTLKGIESIGEWKTLSQKKGESHHYDEMVGEFLHTMHESDHAFRLIVIKKRITPILPHLEELLSEEERLRYAQERYTLIATNAPESMSAEAIVHFYRKRGDESENRIKELKNGFNLRYLPTSHFLGNALYFQIGTLAYNLFVLFKQTFQDAWQRHTIQTIRVKFYSIAGKVIHHARRTILKVNTEFVEVLERIRQRVHDVSLE